MRRDIAGAVRDAADALAGAALAGMPCDPVRTALGPAAGLDVGYAVQSLMRERALCAGRSLSGWKLGVTSPQAQRQYGIDEPLIGALYADRGFPSGATIPAGMLLQPRVEAELAIVFGAAITGARGTGEVARAVDHVVPAVEFADSRIRNWDITALDNVADNGCAGTYVLGERRFDLHAIEEAEIVPEFSIGTRPLARETAHPVTGSILTALTRLGEHLGQWGLSLRAGDVVMTGAIGQAYPVRAGEIVHVDFGSLGAVWATAARTSSPPEGDGSRPGPDE